MAWKIARDYGRTVISPNKSLMIEFVKGRDGVTCKGESLYFVLLFFAFLYSKLLTKILIN